MLILVRHGRTQANASGLLLGRHDPPLDDVGEAQADAVAAELGHQHKVVASPLTRTRQTAKAMTNDVAIDPRWIELDYGDWDGTPTSEIPAETWAAWMADPHFAPPGGESIAQLGARVRDACDELVCEAANQDVVVVSHVSPIKAAVAWALGVNDEVAWRLYLAPASITRISYSGGRRVLHSFNETAHLILPRAKSS